MKGLLLKDFYMLLKYCRMYFLISVVFIVLSAFGGDNYFLICYPCIIAGMLPVTLLGYDERSRWNEYSGTLPVTKAQIVSGKYLIGLFAQIACIVLLSLVQLVRMYMDSVFDIGSYLTLIAQLMILSCFSSSALLPFMFKFGVEKGRIAYYIIIGFIFAAAAVVSHIERAETFDFSSGALLLILSLASVAVYALSWCLSVVFYKKREG